ncbi:hypothetical protein GWI33_022368 [Rhynchophorus ferrugineus]|uniref:Uncharacterized protein n=1 Tax=Rhynchophorus ferrugineus TaxID=354439 RepID=A0A834MHM8_RHYFE|nr:hypothetical protein GWI33_022368 [Rhynchophorus ferrugineus]
MIDGVDDQFVRQLGWRGEWSLCQHIAVISDLIALLVESDVICWILIWLRDSEVIFDQKKRRERKSAKKRRLTGKAKYYNSDKETIRNKPASDRRKPTERVRGMLRLVRTSNNKTDQAENSQRQARE